MTHSPSHTALAWREIAESPKDQELLVKGGHYQIAAETYPEWYEAKGVALVQWREHDGWRGEICDGDYIWHRPTHFITVADLLAPPGTEPPQSINTHDALQAENERLREQVKELPGLFSLMRMSIILLSDAIEIAETNGYLPEMCMWKAHIADLRRAHALLNPQEPNNG